ncbi:hypothetical protein APTSU1_000972800 [Apodemus speciosus]|uniref:Uncharacterized protein n=1 Tax=Apodemus speciosus TaxID=105296 RepID=A0ABQ0F5J8_APOSI
MPPCLRGLFEDVTVEAAAFWSASRQLSSTGHSQRQQFVL